MFAMMEYITGTVERHWTAHKTRGEPPGAPLFLGRSIMLIDEAWHLISRPETGAYANNLARRARHLGLVLIVMSQQLSDFDTEHGVALLGNCSQQLLLSQNPKEIPFIADTVQLSEREAAELARLKTVKGRHAQMLWLNGTRGHGKVALQGRADRVLGVHLRPDRGSDPRGRDRTPPGQRMGRDRAARQARDPRAPRPPARPHARPMNDSEHARDRFEPRLGRASRVTVLDQEPNATEVSVTSRQPPPSPERSPAVPQTEPAQGRRAPRAAASGVRAVRRGGREHPRLPDRARRSMRAARGEVLVADTGGPGGGIAHYAGVETPRSLSEVSELLAAGLPVGQLLATTGDGLRVLATGPRSRRRLRARRHRAAARPCPRALRADRHRLRHARPPSRPDGARAKPRTSRGCCPPAPARWTAAARRSTRSHRTRPAARCSSPATTHPTAEAPCASCETSRASAAPR